jgi:Galactose oxidase, central domain/Domain of unknown function (DUF4214)
MSYTEEARMENQRNHARHRVVLILALVGSISVATMLLGPARRVTAQAAFPSWTSTGNLNNDHHNHTATLLPNGNVLVAAGASCFSGYCYGSNSTELYDQAKRTWSISGALNDARAGHTATLLPNGKVLVAGGFNDDGEYSTSLNSAELYDPATGTWTGTGNLSTARNGHTATLLPNGRVLVVGGADSNFSSAELYDPVTGTWSGTGNSHYARSGHTATLLANGKVLVAGGYNCAANNCSNLNTAELYDPAIGTWTGTGNFNTARNGHTATLLPNGKVLVAGGFDSNHSELNSAELYDPATGLWSRTGNSREARTGHTATLLQNGKVLVAAGHNSPGGGLNTAELYDPATGTWVAAANPNAPRSFHTATLLPSGKVLVAGGFYNTAELYDPGTNQIDDAQFFVRQQYLDFLDREPDAGGLAYWTNQIAQCVSDARCIHQRRIGVSAAFFVEPEFQETGYFVYRFYKASFGRQPSYNDFTSDRGKVIGAPNLEAYKQAFAEDWVRRPAFLEAYTNTMSNTEFVNKLFDTAGLTGAIYEPQRRQEIEAMNAGKTRALALRDVIEIPDFKNIPDPKDPRYDEIKQTSQYNPAFVLMQYFGYLRRDVDRDGYDFWLDVVNNREPNNYHGMVCAFITSSEYQLRFGSVLTRSNADCGQ